MKTFDRAAAFRRAVDFMRAVEERSYTRKEPWSLGTAFFHDDYPAKWVLNFLRLEHEDPKVSAAEIAREADILMGGLRHRMLHVEDAVTA
ncbi:MAG: GNAT family N-acetyltransferase, partial [Actinomycetota bacterium]